MIFMDEAGEAELLKKLPDCHSARWYPTFFDLSPKGGTKVKGIDMFVKKFGISLEETMSFGDGGNDLEMIRHTAVSIAVGNANEKLKEAADYVTAGPAEGGIEAALKHYHLL